MLRIGNRKNYAFTQSYLLRIHNRPLPDFQRPLIPPAKVPLECLVSCLLTLQRCHFNLSMSPHHAGIPGNEIADTLAKA